MEGNLAKAKSDNEELKKKVEVAEKKLKDAEDKNGEKMSPEQYLEVLSEEKDLEQMQKYLQIVQGKFMAMSAENYLEQVKKGNANAQNPWPGMAQMMGSGAMQNSAAMPFSNFSAPPGAMPMQGF